MSRQPARTWEEGLICGNGTIGANALSRPLNERIIFSHERLFLPMGPPVMPPDQSARLFEIRRLIDKGLYKQACELQFKLSGQDGLMYPDYFVPAFDLYARLADRTRSVPLLGRPIRILGPEDLLTLKMMFFRRKDLADAEAVLRASSSSLDLPLVRAALVAMVGEDDERVREWDSIDRDATE